MRRLTAVFMLATLMPMLAGCGINGEVENQAYALVLGVDQTEAGGIELTIRIPRIGQSGNEEAGGSTEQKAYLVLAASGNSYAQALEHLQWAAARELNLSHLELIIVSSALARSETFPELIDSIAETRHLYTTAAFIVCENRARDFIEGQETIMGAHLSSDIAAMFSHYAAHGYVPCATFADLYYATRSCYSDPLGIWGFPDIGEQKDKPAIAAIDDVSGSINVRTTTASSRQYLGTAVFRNGRLVQTLDAEDTLLLNLLTRKVDAFTFSDGDNSIILSCSRGPRRRMTVNKGKVEIHIRLWLSAESFADQNHLDAAAKALSLALMGFIQRCQEASIEPLGLAERAAIHFATLNQWRAFDWRSRFSEASVEVEVGIAPSE